MSEVSASGSGGQSPVTPPPPIRTPASGALESSAAPSVLDVSSVVVPSHIEQAIIPVPRTSDAVILHTAFAPTEGEMYDGADGSRIARTETLAWGRGDLGQLMQPELVSSNIPLPVPRLDSFRVVSVACSPYHTLVITDTGELLAAGLNDEGQLFANSKGTACIPQPQLMDTLSTQRIIAVATGTSHTAVLLSTGSVLTFGNNEYGQLGHSPDKPANVGPRAVVGMGSGKRAVIQVACGDEHTVMLTNTGEVYTCGNGVHGALGHGNRQSVSEPKRVESLTGVPIVQISAGGYHTTAVTMTGQAYSWGRNRYGQLGIGSKDHSIVSPTRITSIPRLIQQTSCGHDHTVFLTVCGEIYACGRGTSGQLGLGPSTDTLSLEAVLLPVRIYFPGEDVLSLVSPDTPLAAGAGYLSPPAAKFGLPKLEAPVPVTLPDVPMTPKPSTPMYSTGSRSKRARQVACGSRHTVVLTVPGDVYVFGSNSEGQLGLGDGVDTVDVPTVVPSLSHKGVFFVDAGGDCSVAIRVTRGSVLSTAPGSLPKGVLQSIDSSQLLVEARVAIAREDFEPLKKRLRDVFSSPSCVSASFLTRSEHKYYITHTDAATMQAHVFNAIKHARLIMDAHDESMSPSGGPSEGPVVLEACSGCYDLPPGWSETEHWRVSSSVGVEGLDVAMSVVMSSRQADVRDTLLKAIAECLDELNAHYDVLEPDAVRPLFTLLLLPLYSGQSMSSSAPLYDRLIRIVNALPSSQKQLLHAWIMHDVSSQLFVTRLVDTALAYVELYVTSFLRAPEGRQVQFVAPLQNVLSFLAFLHAINVEAKLCPPAKFYSGAVSDLSDDILKTDYMRWLQTRRSSPDNFAFCKYPFLFNADAKRRILHVDVEARQAMEMQNALVRHLFLGEEPFLIMRVRRSNLLDDTVMALRSMSPASFKKPMKVVFEGEEGLDAGGVTKEFFQLLSHRLFDPAFGMFVTMPETNDTWFNLSSPRDADRDFELIGTLVGLAIYNRVLLDLRFPLTVYKKLLNRPLGLEELAEVDPSVAQSMRRLLEYKADDIEDVFCLTFTASYEELGVVKTVELRKGGASIAVTQDNKREFVAAYVKWFLVDSVNIQFRNFARGFSMVLDGAALELFGPEELAMLVCGTPELNFHDLERVTEYEGYTRTDEVIKMFWNVVHSMTPQAQVKLLMFVTGCAKAPIGGLGKMKMKIQRNDVDSDRLPTASTCFNTLLLPPYSSEEKMRDRLMTAIENCSGFGLQ